MNSPLITVLMPVWNGEAYLREALDSVFRQRGPDFEVLVVDDGSTDRTPEILEACGDPRLRVRRNESRLKLSGALNRGMDEARGKWIARMDADDRMCPGRLAVQAAFMEAHREIGICGGWVRTFGDGPSLIRKYPSEPAVLKAFSLFYTPFGHPTVLFRKDWFDRENLRYDGSFYPTEDYELWARALTRFAGGNLPQVLTEYRTHGASMTGSGWDEMDAQTVRVHRFLLSRIGLQPTEEESRIHRSASMGQMPAEPESFHQADRWLRDIQEANQVAGEYESEALDAQLRSVWLRMTMGVVRRMGSEAWQLYRGSSWAGNRRQRMLVRLAALKADWKGRRE